MEKIKQTVTEQLSVTTPVKNILATDSFALCRNGRLLKASEVDVCRAYRHKAVVNGHGLGVHVALPVQVYPDSGVQSVLDI